MRAGQRDDVRAWPSTTGVDRRNRHENNQPTTDVARHAPVSAGAAHGPSRTAFHQRAHGPRRALGGCDERIFLVALGAIWTEVKLPSPAKAMAYWTALYGTYANWLTTTLAAVFGTAAATPVAAAGHRGQPWQESL